MMGASPGGRGSGNARFSSPFGKLIRYMNRGIEDGEGRAVLWHNFYGGDRTPEDEILREFEGNAKLLDARKNGNVLYHEILSFSKGHQARGDELYRMVADIGQEYLRERAPNQLGYGVVHLDTDHIHLHLMLSANEAGRSDRVRLSKAEFAEVQARVERFTLERYQALAQTQIYGRERSPERLKTQVHEQAMKARTGEPSRKEALKAKLHQLFERARTVDELGRLLSDEGVSFYSRGKSVGIVVRDQDGTERRHRLSTLGLESHYVQTNARLLARPDQVHDQEKTMGQDNMPGMHGRDAFERKPSTVEIVAEEFITGKLHPEWHGTQSQEPQGRPYTDDVLRRVRNLENQLLREQEPAKTPQDKKRDDDRGR
jgi:hypothetical protein